MQKNKEKELKMNDPDIIDLQSWLCTSEDPTIKQFWLATKYLSSPYELWLKFWKKVGSPDIYERI